MHTGTQTDHDSWPCSLISQQSARDSDMTRHLSKVCLAIVLLSAACTVAGASPSVNSGEQLALELPSKPNEPHHKLIITDKHPSSNEEKGLDPHAGVRGDSEPDKPDAVAAVDRVVSTQYATSTAGSITSTDTLASSSAGFEVRFVSVKGHLGAIPFGSPEECAHELTSCDTYVGVCLRSPRWGSSKESCS